MRWLSENLGSDEIAGLTFGEAATTGVIGLAQPRAIEVLVEITEAVTVSSAPSPISPMPRGRATGR